MNVVKGKIKPIRDNVQLHQEFLFQVKTAKVKVLNHVGVVFGPLVQNNKMSMLVIGFTLNTVVGLEGLQLRTKTVMKSLLDELKTNQS